MKYVISFSVALLLLGLYFLIWRHGYERTYTADPGTFHISVDSEKRKVLLTFAEAESRSLISQEYDLDAVKLFPSKQGEPPKVVTRFNGFQGVMSVGIFAPDSDVAV